MLSLLKLVLLFAVASTALPAPEPEVVEYEDLCEAPLPAPSIISPSSSQPATPVPQATGSSTASFSVQGPFANATSSSTIGGSTLAPGFNSTPTSIGSATTSAPPFPTGPASNGSVTNTTSSGGSNAANPFLGKQIYANPYYASEIAAAIPSMTANAAQASAVAQVGTFSWLDTAAKVPNVGTFLGNIQKQNAGASTQTMGAFVVYDLPNRDCAAAASNGEYSLAADGLNKYKAYIDAIKAELAKFPDVPVALVIEPDSLGNLVTNLATPNCTAAADAYKEGVAYAIKTLDQANVAQYLDAGHAGWLGWPANIAPAAQLFAEVYKSAGEPKSVRGLATNVANYNAFSASACPSYTQGSKVCDEKTYINNLAPLLQQNGFPAHFIIDTGRNGKQPTGQQEWGDWCNVRGAGFGARPTTETGDPLADAFVWVKPGGESDGTSNTTAPRFDRHCAAPAALTPAPQAGSWFQAYFEQLVANANPAFS